MPSSSDISDTILGLFSRVHIRITPGDLVREVRRILPDETRRSVRDAIGKLVTQGRLIYTHHFSASHLELNFRQPVQVSDRIYLLPVNAPEIGKIGCVGVRLLDSAVFGGGDHPTTRMALRGIDTVLAQDRSMVSHKKMRALDIGTGSGVLALAALKLGVAMAVGIDIDPLARDTAKKNACHNKLAHRFEVATQLPDEKSGKTFDLILANLRPPTMKQLLAKLIALSSPGAVWVLSGFRIDEQTGVENEMTGTGMHLIWQANECQWASLALKFRKQPHGTMTAGS